jgi:hypothetical protein
MEWTRRWAVGTLVGTILFIMPAAVAADDLGGMITTTRVITQDSRLVDNVTCMVTGAPCIAFGAPRISLRLNGFTITGLADPTNGCSGAFTANEQGITSAGQSDVEVRGPGVVQRFRADGVLFVGSIGGKVEGITATTNCQSGIRVAATASRITIASNISVRNGTTLAPCGGI